MEKIGLLRAKESNMLTIPTYTRIWKTPFDSPVLLCSCVNKEFNKNSQKFSLKMAQNYTFFIHKIIFSPRKGLNHIWLERSRHGGHI